MIDKGPRRQLLESLPKGCIWAEAGVWQGDFSHHILTICQPRELHLIDPWRFMPQYPDRLYGGGYAKRQAAMNRIYRKVLKRFSEHPQVTVHRTTSAQAASTFVDGTFDFVYIDGDHSYDFVLQDLRLWAPKVKPGGKLMGDDYLWTQEDRAVQRAVQDFVAESGLPPPSIIHSQFVIEV